MNSESLPQFSTILEAIQWATARFKNCPFDSHRLNAELLLCQVVDLRRLDLYMKFDQPLSAEEVSTYSDLVERRLTGEPVQYIVGETEFYGLPFNVTPDVLIPRPETEILVDHAIDYIRQLEAPSDLEDTTPEPQLDLFSAPPTPKLIIPDNRIMVDIGTGSGVLALTVATHCPDLKVYASDISEEALKIAKQNARSLEVDVHFLSGDGFLPLHDCKLEGLVDLIISNPPYIATSTVEQLPEEVRLYEPRQALDGGEDGLDYLRAFIHAAPPYLRPGGKIMMEISHEQGDQVLGELKSMAEFYNDGRLIQDYNQLNRFVSAVRTDVEYSSK